MAPGKIMIRNLFTDPPWIAGEGIICNDRNILLGNLISGHETIVKPFLFSRDTPATYGDTGPLRGPGNRAIGRGALAERALEPVLPDEKSFPYVVRIVSEIFGSNGSSSMASTCGSTLALMDAGVRLKKPVASIAMGLASEGRKWTLPTDLQDIEDGPGGMDFKITGTRDGVTAIQMDTKTDGLTWDIVDQTFARSKEARLKIIAAMHAVMPEPRKEMSPYAPSVVTLMINPEKIRDVIGPSGKMINKIIAETGVSMDIKDDGRVNIISNNSESMEKAIHWVKKLTHEVTRPHLNNPSKTP